MFKNNQKYSDIMFIALLLFIHSVYSLKSTNNQNSLSVSVIPELKKKVIKNEVSFLNKMQKSILLQKDQSQGKTENETKDESYETMTDSKNMVYTYYMNYEQVKKEMSKEFETNFGFCKNSIRSVYDTCKVTLDHIKDKIAYNNISTSMYFDSKDLFEKYNQELKEMEGISNDFKEYFESLEEHNSIEFLLDIASDVYQNYPQLIDKYKITEELKLTTDDKLETEISKLGKATQKEVDDLLNKLNKDNYLGEKYTGRIKEESLPKFKINEELNKTMEDLKKDKNSKEYALDREAKGQMLFDKLSWYLDYNTKNEEDMLQGLEMLKLRLEAADLKIKKNEIEMEEIIAEKAGLAGLRVNEENILKEDFYNCQSLTEIQDKCDEASNIYDKMIGALDLETKLQNKVSDILTH